MKFEVTMTGVTVAISDPAANPDGRRRATIQLYRPLAPAVASRARVGDRWTIAVQREVAI